MKTEKQLAVAICDHKNKVTGCQARCDLDPNNPKYLPGSPTYIGPKK